MTAYTKPAYSIDDQIKKMEERGMVVPDKVHAKRYLRSIGYFRLSAYFPPFYQAKDNFAENTTFEMVLDLYIRDRKLRLLAVDALERIEVSIRAAITDTMSSNPGPHWFMDEKYFRSDYTARGPNNARSGYETLLSCVAYNTGQSRPEKRNLACKHYYENYSSPDYPPCWVVMEALTMGTVSRLFEGLKTRYQKKISKVFDFDKNDLLKWAHALTNIRNQCAHHGRFWNHPFPATATNIAKYTYKEIPLNKPYTNFALIFAFLLTFTHNPTWSKRLYESLKDWPLDIGTHMGFPENWEEIPFWRI